MGTFFDMPFSYPLENCLSLVFTYILRFFFMKYNPSSYLSKNLCLSFQTPVDVSSGKYILMKGFSIFFINYVIFDTLIFVVSEKKNM